MYWNLTLSNSDMVALRAPSGRPKGKTKRKLVKWRSNKILKRSLTTLKHSFSSWVTVPTPSCLKGFLKIISKRLTTLYSSAALQKEERKMGQFCTFLIWKTLLWANFLNALSNKWKKLVLRDM